jgi:RpiB/LacA/LacB family sugar-phosphate isomerase
VNVGLGSDEPGEMLRGAIQRHLQVDVDRGIIVFDIVCSTGDTTFGPELAESMGLAILSGSIERGILVCSSGVGLAIAANKVPGIRAVLCSDVETAIHSRKSGDTHILVLGRNSVSEPLAIEIVDTWLETPFEPNDRRRTRLEMLRGLESRYMRLSGQDERKSGDSQEDSAGGHGQAQAHIDALQSKRA